MAQTDQDRTDFKYRSTARFVGEVQLALSVVLIACGVVSSVWFASMLKNLEGLERDMAVGYLTFSLLTVTTAVTDVAFAIALISSTRKISLTNSLLWRGSTFTTVVLFGFLTMCFLAMMKNPWILVGYVPTLLFKPTALWMVNPYIDELREWKSYPDTEDFTTVNEKVLEETQRRLSVKYSRNDMVVIANGRGESIQHSQFN